MKKSLKWLAIAFLVLCFFFSCTQVRKNVITGQIEGLKAGDKIVLASYHRSADKWMADDSVTVKTPGEFLLKTYDNDEQLRLFLVPQGDTVDVASLDTPSLDFFAEGLDKYVVTGTASDFPGSKVIGGVYDYPEVKHIDSLETLRESLRAERAAIDRMDTATGNRLSEKWQRISDEIYQAQKAVIKKYPDNAFAAYTLQYLGFTTDAERVDQIDSLYISLTEKAQKTFYGKSVKKRVENIRNSVVGAQAADFTLTSIAGDTIRLADMKGKWVVLDFWASWCKPCRMYNPEMVKIYEKYHPDGLEVIGVAAWDADADWRKAVAEDALPWVNVNSGEKVKGQDNVSDTYAITSVPTAFLIDPQGKIVYRGHPMGLTVPLHENFPQKK